MSTCVFEMRLTYYSLMSPHDTKEKVGGSDLGQPRLADASRVARWNENVDHPPTPWWRCGWSTPRSPAFVVVFAQCKRTVWC